MLITDLLEDINKFKENEIEFRLIDKNGDLKKLDLCLNMGKYLYKMKDEDGNDKDIIILGLEIPNA
jgi:hypothetical protein